MIRLNDRPCRAALLWLSLWFGLWFGLWGFVPAAQGQWISDAFGLYHPEHQPERRSWAGVQGETFIQSPQTAQSLQIIMAEKSLISGRGRAMAVALGLDRHGNLMADGQTALFILSGEPASLSAVSVDGLAYILVPETQRAGLFWAATRLEGEANLQSERQLYRITADMRSLTPLVQGSAIGDVRAQLSTPVLTDGFGNIVGDGQGFVFMLRRGKSHGLIPALSVNGRVQAQLPRDLLDREQGLRLLTNFAASEDQPLAYAKPTLLAQIPLTSAYDRELGLLEITWGPLRTNDGHLLPDGTRVQINLRTSLFDPREREAWVEGGLAKANLFLWAEDFPAELTLQTPFGVETYEVRP